MRAGVGPVWPRRDGVFAHGQGNHGLEVHQPPILWRMANGLVQNTLVYIIRDTVPAMHGAAAALDTRPPRRVAGAVVTMLIRTLRLNHQAINDHVSHICSSARHAGKLTRVES